MAFFIYQSGARANGGVESVTQLIENLRNVERVVFSGVSGTVSESRWKGSGAALESVTGSQLARWRTIYGRLRVLRPNVVHANDIHSVVDALLPSRLLGIPVALNVRDTLSAGQRYGSKWPLVVAGVRRIIGLSSEMAETLDLQLPKLFGRRAPISFVYSAASESWNHQEKAPIPDDAVAIGYVANVCDKKNQLAFLKGAARRILDAYPSVRIYFIGDFDPERNVYHQACRNAVSELGLGERVRFVGYDEDVTKWYRTLDLLVLASRREGLARCMIEGLACGTPMVSFDVCSAKEVLEGKAEMLKGELNASPDNQQQPTTNNYQCGIVVPQGDYAALADAVVRLAGDRELRERMGRNGREVAKRLFDPAKSVAEYERIYREMLER